MHPVSDPHPSGLAADGTPVVSDEIERYLLTGETDYLYRAWPGNGIFERAERAHADLRGALIRTVRQRTLGLRQPAVLRLDSCQWTRAKVAPMVRGLFRRDEQEVVLTALAQSVVFLTDQNIEALLRAPGFDRLAWDIANIYLGSFGAPLLSEDAPLVVGLSEETTCYVSPESFTAQDPFADFVVHEVAHVFQNTKRATLGLPASRSREWLLDIGFLKRETFAYACEAFSRVITQAKDARQRRELVEQYAREPRIFDERADQTEVANILEEACMARNGWKVILARCAPSRTVPSRLRSRRHSRGNPAGNIAIDR